MSGLSSFSFAKKTTTNQSILKDIEKDMKKSIYGALCNKQAASNCNNFKEYYDANVQRMTLKYSFLTKCQIKAKLKQSWTNEERRKSAGEELSSCDYGLRGSVIRNIKELQNTVKNEDVKAVDTDTLKDEEIDFSIISGKTTKKTFQNNNIELKSRTPLKEIFYDVDEDDIYVNSSEEEDDEWQCNLIKYEVSEASTQDDCDLREGNDSCQQLNDSNKENEPPISKSIVPFGSDMEISTSKEKSGALSTRAPEKNIQENQKSMSDASESSIVVEDSDEEENILKIESHLNDPSCDIAPFEEDNTPIMKLGNYSSMVEPNEENETPILNPGNNFLNFSVAPVLFRRNKNLRSIKKEWPTVKDGGCDIRTDLNGENDDDVDDKDDGDSGFLTNMFDKADSISCQRFKGRSLFRQKGEEVTKDYLIIDGSEEIFI